MLEAYVGPAAFRDGVRRYMHAHAYGNTVDADLWREVQAVAGKPVLDVEADFTRQPGLPLLKVEAERTSGTEMKVVLSRGTIRRGSVDYRLGAGSGVAHSHRGECGRSVNHSPALGLGRDDADGSG
jgi:aminopeptidase N